MKWPWHYALVLAALLNAVTPVMACCDTPEAVAVHAGAGSMAPCHGEGSPSAPSTEPPVQGCKGCADCVDFATSDPIVLSVAGSPSQPDKPSLIGDTGRPFVAGTQRPVRLTGPPPPNDGPRATPITLHQRLLI